MKALSFTRRCGGMVSGRTLAFVVIAIILVLAALYLLYPKSTPEPIPIPEPIQEPSLESPPPLETVEPAQSEEERGDSAREVIAELRADPDRIDYDQAYARAQEFQAAGQLADAQLLYFFAARGGNGPAAFELATFYDPIHFSQDASLMEEPDPFQAYKWYMTALEAGNGAARDRLAELQGWAEKAAGTGDIEAEQLLQQWE
jgi:serine/threonine-protein kinase